MVDFRKKNMMAQWYIIHYTYFPFIRWPIILLYTYFSSFEVIHLVGVNSNIMRDEIYVSLSTSLVACQEHISVTSVLLCHHIR